MAIGTTNISLGLIASELGIPVTDLSLYDTAGLSDSGDGTLNKAVNYHNISFGPGNVAVPDNLYYPYTSQSDLSLNSWRNYNHLASMVFNWNIQNTTRGTCEFELYVERPVYGAELIDAATIASGGSWIGTDYISSIASDPGVGYVIILAYICTDGTVPNVTSVSDTDGVGPSTTRSFTPLPPFVPPMTPFLERVVDDSGGDIAWSKRTSFNMTV